MHMLLSCSNVILSLVKHSIVLTIPSNGQIVIVSNVGMTVFFNSSSLSNITNAFPIALLGGWHHEQQRHRRQVHLRERVWGWKLRCSAHRPRYSVDGQSRARHQQLTVLHHPEESRTPGLQTRGFRLGSGWHGCGATDGGAGHEGRHAHKEAGRHRLWTAVAC